MQSTCGAKTRTGEPCKSKAMDNGRCRMHGGKSLTGINASNFKTGRYSKYMPEALLARYEDALADDDLNNARSSIALIDAMIAGALPALDTADAGKVWQDMKKYVADCRLAYKREDYPGLEKTLDSMDDLANRRLKHYATYDQVQSLLDDRRKHIETENKLELAGQRAISVEQVMLLVSNVLNIIQTTITDRSQRHAIATKIQQLISIPASVDVSE